MFSLKTRVVALVALPCMVAPIRADGGISAREAPGPIVSFEVTEATEIGDSTYYSSSRMEAAWAWPGKSVHEWKLVVAEPATGLIDTVFVDGDILNRIITGLKSGTEYELTVSGILASGRGARGLSAIATTPEEVWQLKGAEAGVGNTFDECWIVVENGNVLSWPFLYGDDAPGSFAGKVRFYYKPFPRSEPSGGVRVAISKEKATEDPESVASFVTLEGFGLRNPPFPATLVKQLAACQGVPLSAEMGGGVRLFFEAAGADRLTRYMYLDSQDYYRGQDFHPGDPTVVEETEDYETGGPAEPTVVIGVLGEPADSTTGLYQARQSKMGWPTLDSWTWDGASGTFMIITGADVCEQTNDGLFYAVWDGGAWSVVKDEDDACARPLVLDAHGPVVVHRGGHRYKVYYEDQAEGRSDKPFHLLYADAERSGAEDRVEIEDWDAESSAREVHFRWPDGSALTRGRESGLGDHAILCPAGGLEVQVMYLNLGGKDDSSAPRIPAGLGMAILVNP